MGVPRITVVCLGLSALPCRVRADTEPGDESPKKTTPGDAPAAESTVEAQGAAIAPFLANLVEPPSRPREQGLAEPELPEAVEEAPEQPVLELGGALRYNFFVKTWDQPETITAGGDDIAFDTFRINVDSYYQGFHMSAEYRFYAGYTMLHHGYLAYVEPDAIDVAAGVMRVPFGLLPYASHNFFFGLTYYLGLEDDYDLGLRTDYELGPFDVQVAYFRNDEGDYTGSSIDSARYSYDVVRTDEGELSQVAGPRRNEEKNQVNARATYTSQYAAGSSTFGLSGQLGGVENADTDQLGRHWAAAAHFNGTFGPVNVQAQAARYGYDLKTPPDQDRRFVVFGAYDAPYLVASHGTVLTANVACKVEVDWGPIESWTFYNDYSILLKDNDRFADSHQNTTGVLMHAGPVYAYFDAVAGKHHPWIGPSYATALAEGNASDTWEARFNSNLGYYF